MRGYRSIVIIGNIIIGKVKKRTSNRKQGKRSLHSKAQYNKILKLKKEKDCLTD